jgi:hypothetical protein
MVYRAPWPGSGAAPTRAAWSIAADVRVEVGMAPASVPESGIGPVRRKSASVCGEIARSSMPRLRKVLMGG